jgi:hypothetical protein
MPKHDQTTKVSPIPHEKFRYLCESWEKPDQPHTVDLLAYGGNGECDCISFCAEKRSGIKAGITLFTSQSMCRHIIAARDYLLNEILKDQSAAQLNPDA